LVAEIPPLRGPTRQKAARKRKSGRFGRDDNFGEARKYGPLRPLLRRAGGVTVLRNFGNTDVETKPGNAKLEKDENQDTPLPEGWGERWTRREEKKLRRGRVGLRA